MLLDAYGTSCPFGTSKRRCVHRDRGKTLVGARACGCGLERSSTLVKGETGAGPDRRHRWAGPVAASGFDLSDRIARQDPQRMAARLQGRSVQALEIPLQCAKPDGA